MLSGETEQYICAVSLAYRTQAARIATLIDSTETAVIRRAAEIGYVFVTLADIERTRRTKRALGPRRNVAFPQHVRGRVEALGFGTLADRLNAMIAHGLAVLDPRPPLERY